MAPGTAPPTFTSFDLFAFIAVFLVLLIVGGFITDWLEREIPRD